MAMKTRRFKKNIRSRQSGQAAVFLLLGLGLFLLGTIGFAVDMANLWFHRQSSQNAADAACIAAATDIVNDSTGGGPISGGFTPGTAFNCSTNSAYAPCQHAGFNGYTASGLTTGTPSTEVAVDFPGTVSGVQSCSVSPPPPVCVDAATANPYVRAIVTDRIQSFFVGLLSGNKTMDVGARATCAALFSNAPIPILVLNPTISGSLSGSGSILLKIVGGPQRSIQVNSSSTSAVSFSGGSGTIDLSAGGQNGTGSDFGVTGIEPQPSGPTFLYGTTGAWLDPRSVISDPFITIPAPLQPTNTSAMGPGAAIYGDTSTTFGCPDTVVGDGCDHYFPGYYPSGITVKKGKDASGGTNSSASGLAVFERGIYYLGGSGLSADSNSCLRPSSAIGDGSGGTLFYFSGTATLSVTSNSGKLQLKTGSTVNFDCQNLTAGGAIANVAWAVPLTQIRCIPTGSTGATTLPANVVSFGGLVGNVLLGPCQAASSSVGGPNPGNQALCATNCSINYGDPLGATDPLGEQRGMLFFQDRSGNLAATTPTTQPTWQGGGAFGLAGNLYFHYCASATAGGGSGCSASAWTDQLSLGGNSTSNTFVVGDIVTDELSLNGTPGIEMDLNPNALYYVLKATLVQ